MPQVTASPALEAFIDESIRVSREHRYNPHVFLRMRQRYGTLATMEKLVTENSDIQSGFRRMCQLGLTRHTVEAGIIEFSSEFSRNAIQCAGWRLQQAGHRFDVPQASIG